MPGHLHLLLFLLLLWDFLYVFVSVASSVGSEDGFYLWFMSVEQRLETASFADAAVLLVAVAPPGELLTSNMGPHEEGCCCSKMMEVFRFFVHLSFICLVIRPILLNAVSKKWLEGITSLAQMSAR